MKTSLRSLLPNIKSSLSRQPVYSQPVTGVSGRSSGLNRSGQPRTPLLPRIVNNNTRQPTNNP